MIGLAWGGGNHHLGDVAVVSPVVGPSSPARSTATCSARSRLMQWVSKTALFMTGWEFEGSCTWLSGIAGTEAAIRLSMTISGPNRSAGFCAARCLMPISGCCRCHLQRRCRGRAPAAAGDAMTAQQIEELAQALTEAATALIRHRERNPAPDDGETSSFNEALDKVDGQNRRDQWTGAPDRER